MTSDQDQKLAEERYPSITCDGKDVYSRSAMQHIRQQAFIAGLSKGREQGVEILKVVEYAGCCECLSSAEHERKVELINTFLKPYAQKDEV